MPPRRKKPSGLTEDDVARLRSQLDDGRRPRVALSGPQFEGDASGSVIRIGDPAVDGADFLTVRVKVNGVTDELAFAPAELSIGGRTKAPGTGPSGTGSARAGSAAHTRAAQPRPAASNSAAAAETPATGSGSTPAALPGTADRAEARSAAAGSAAPTPTPASPPPASPPPAGSNPTSRHPAGSPAAGRRRKAPAAPVVSVTISSSGAAWSVSASRGARTIARGVPVTPGMVTAIADLLDQAAVSEAVAEINETARQLAQQRAEQLRAELSDLEAVLATHRAPG
jgi:hypothetical protein